MPRSGDRYPARRGGNDVHSPLRGLLDYTAVDMTAGVAGDAIRGKIEDVVAFIKETTGVDLSGVLQLLDVIDTATGVDLGALGALNPVDFIGNMQGALQGIDITNPGAIMAAIIENAGDPIGLVNAITGLSLPSGTANPLDYLTTFGGNLGGIFTGVDLNDATLNPTTGLTQWINNGILPTNLLLGHSSPIPAYNLFGRAPGSIFGLIPVSAIGDYAEELLQNPEFDTAESLYDPLEIFTYDPTHSHTGTGGSARVEAAGVLRELLSDPETRVTPGQKVNMAIHARWEALVSTGDPIRLNAVAYDAAGNELDEVVLASIAAPGTTSVGRPDAATDGFVPLSGTYTVPDIPAIDHVRQNLVVMPTATAGWVNWDDGHQAKTNKLLMPYVEGLPEELQAAADRWQSLVDEMFNAITDAEAVGTLLVDLRAAIRAFPGGLVTGTGGPATVIDSLRETWNQFVGGMVNVPGATGAELPDLFTVGNLVSSWASMGRDAFEVSAIRTNQPMHTGMLPTSTSNISLDKIAFDTSARPDTGGGVAVTQSTARRVYKRVEQYSPIGVVSWTGSGVANLTAFFVNIYRLDQTTGQEDLVHGSANILGDVGSALNTNRYVLPTPIDPEPGEVYVYEFAVRGTGIHRMAGSTSWYPPQNDMYPRRWAGVRNSGTTAPPASIPASGVTYADETPFIEVAITTGAVAIPRTPTSQSFAAPGPAALVVASWANEVQIAALPGAGGGRQGGTYGISGEGGDAGVWATVIWKRGVHFSGSPLLAINVGGGGIGGGRSGTSGGVGNNGEPTTVTLPATPGFPSQTLTLPGGEGGDALNAGGGDMQGRSPGNIVLDGVPYTGGVQQNNFGANGSAPGAGGAGGNYVSFQAGGNGAPGVVHARFKQ